MLSLCAREITKHLSGVLRDRYAPRNDITWGKCSDDMIQGGDCHGFLWKPRNDTNEGGK